MLLPLLLGFSATMLNHAYQRSLRAAERDALRGQIYLLLGAAEPIDKGMSLPPVLAEPRYSSVNSGLMGWVINMDGDIQWRSRSSELLTDDDMPRVTAEFRPGSERFFSLFINSIEYYAIGYDTLWDFDNAEQGFRFVVVNSRVPMYNELEAYRKRLWKWLGGLAFLMIIVQTLIARWGLSPLRKLASDLEKVEVGDQKQLLGNYPADIQPVTNNLNRVLKSEQSQRERYRNTLSDLAHSLKTPLAVIRGQLENIEGKTAQDLAHSVDEQISRMSSIVDHQLRRASAKVTHAGQTSLNLKHLVVRLTTALNKVYHDKTIHCEVAIARDLNLRGDEPDFMELIGNVVDNAYKYGRKQVRISAERVHNDLQILIEDDGSGVAPEARRTILNRGARADTASSGQGIGLAVAVDILSSYGGSIDVFNSSLGGAGFKIVLPNWTL